MRRSILISLLLIVPLSVSAQMRLPKNDRMVQQAVGGVALGSLGAVTLGIVFAQGVYYVLYEDGISHEETYFGQGLGEAYMSLAIGGTIAYLVVGSFAITVIGNDDNPIKGKWVPTLAGNSIGLLVGYMGLSAMIDSDIDNPVILLGWVAGSATTGALLGYNTSRVDVRITPDITRALTVRIPL